MSERPPGEDALARAWRLAAADPQVSGELELLFDHLAREVARRGPACWASGRCCNFVGAGHDLFVTGLEAAYTVARSGREPTLAEIDGAKRRGDCPFLSGNLCGVHGVKPLACRAYFCDRSAQDWQRSLNEVLLRDVRALHDRHGVPYRYAEWRSLLALLVG